MPSLNKKLLFEENFKKLIDCNITKLYKQKLFNLIKDLDDIFIIEFNDGYFTIHVQSFVRIRKKNNIILTSSDNYLDENYNELKNDLNDVENTLFKKNIDNVFSELSKCKVIDSKTKNLGDLTIHFENDFFIEIFIDVPKDCEFYRFILNDNHYILKQKNGIIKYSIQRGNPKSNNKIQ